MARPKGTTRTKKPITKWEYDKLIYFCKKNPEIKQQKLRVKLIRAFTLLYLTGCRVSEIHHLRTSDLEFICKYEEYLLPSGLTKTKKDRLISFSKNQIEILKAIIPNMEKPLFDVSCGYLTIKLNKIMHKCLGALYSTHSFRQGYITKMIKDGNDLHLVKKDIGHKSPYTTLEYVSSTQNEIKAAKERILW